MAAASALRLAAYPRRPPVAHPFMFQGNPHMKSVAPLGTYQFSPPEEVWWDIQRFRMGRQEELGTEEE